MILTVPSGVLPLHLENLMDIYPISTSFLRETMNPSLSMSYHQMFLAGAFRIRTHMAYNRTTTSIMVSEERQFNVPLTVEIRNIRSSSFNIDEWCLAMYTEETGWQCVGNLTETDTQVYDTSIKACNNIDIKLLSIQLVTIQSIIVFMKYNMYIGHKNVGKW